MEENPKPAGSSLNPADKKKISDMAKFLARAVSQTHDFGMNHPLAKQPIEDCFSVLNNLIIEKGNIAVYIGEKKLKYGDTFLEDRNPVVDKLIALFTAIKLVSLEFERGFNHEDLLNFLSIMAMRPQDISAVGGIEKLFKDKNISHLKLNPIKYELIGMGEKVVSQQAKINDEDLNKELEKIFAQSDEGEEKLKEENPEEKLLSLIAPSLQKDATQADFIDSMVKDPLDEVHSIVEAVRLVNKVGGEKAKEIVSSVNKRLDSVRDDLYTCLIGNKDDEDTKKIYKSAAVLGKELSKQLKTIQVNAELSPLIGEMGNVLEMIMDQAEAEKMLTGLLKGEMTVKKKVTFLKSMLQRSKLSPDFEFMISKVLSLKGMPEAEVSQLMGEKTSLLEQAEKDKEATGLETKAAVEKLRSENVRLSTRSKALHDAFSKIEEGIMLLDAEGEIALINRAAEEIMNLTSGNNLDKAALALLKLWQPGAAIDLEKLIADNQLEAGEKVRLEKILAQIRIVQKNDQGLPGIVVFKSTS
ncbi:MAG: hypothetical protein MUC39_05225 [Candidatus Omnitrophica bacterium]|jgi:hypothetical protein|nr:hypothetical protein [Candidatus Omnitrophota bacterium]